MTPSASKLNLTDKLLCFGTVGVGRTRRFEDETLSSAALFTKFGMEYSFGSLIIPSIRVFTLAGTFLANIRIFVDIPPQTLDTFAMVFVFCRSPVEMFAKCAAAFPLPCSVRFAAQLASLILFVPKCFRKAKSNPCPSLQLEVPTRIKISIALHSTMTATILRAAELMDRSFW